MEKHIPKRMCIACREMYEQNMLIRIVNENGEAVLDTDKKRFGRGAYICKKTECVKKAQKRRAIEKHLKCNATVGLYEECMSLADEL